MANWTTPIYDRTQADVDYARQQIAQQINTGEYKGCFNYTDINRIENNTRYLSDTLFALSYFNALTTTTWTASGTPSQNHVDRIINNINVLWEKWGKPPNAMSLPDTLLTYEQVNNIEKNIFFLKEMLDNMTSSFKQCNTFECGEA